MALGHFVILVYPAQGHLNPAVELARRLLALGARVTFATTPNGRRCTSGSQLPDGISFADIKEVPRFRTTSQAADHEKYVVEFRRRCTEGLVDIFKTSESAGHPVTCVIYALFQPWAAEVARQHGVPSALLWIQPAAVLAVYQHYYNGYRDMIIEKGRDPSSLIELPGLPPLTSRDLPSFLAPSNAYSYILPLLNEQFEGLRMDPNPRVLVNSFDALEEDGLRQVKRGMNTICVGPLVPTHIFFGSDPSQVSEHYMEWLNSKPEGSVVYVSFGTIAEISKQQNEEIARGLLDSGRPFLWVIREKKEEEEKKEELECMAELRQRGMVVAWCSQAEVLRHRSVGCFVSHCGWNSTLESLAAGVPVVAVPQWSDQGTNAKLLEEVWKTAIRASTNGDGIVEGREIRRCVEEVMGDGEKGIELKRNAQKWRASATEAMDDQAGSSLKNLKSFVDDLTQSASG